MMDVNAAKTSRKAGLPPGALIHIGSKKSNHVKLSEFCYNEKEFAEKNIEKVDEITPPADSSDKVTWINLDGVHNVEIIAEIGTRFALHGLLLEDILNTNHRPTAEYYKNHMIFTLKMLGLNKSGTDIVSEQVSLVLGKSYLLSFQEREGDLFDKVRERVRTGKGKVRSKKADYLFYTLIDAIVDNYYIIIEQFSEKLERLEDSVFNKPDDYTLKDIQDHKKQLATLRKAVYPLREAISSIIKNDENLFRQDNIKYLKDVYEHTIHIIDTIESLRDIAGGLKDLYMSELSNRMNNTMKVLTIIATIFIPLTFIAGIYGMNFDHMPELHHKWAYPAVWLLMILITIGMVIYFKKKKWL